MTKEKIKTTEGVLIEAQDDAEILVCVEQAEKVRDEMVPDQEWMRDTLERLHMEELLDKAQEGIDDDDEAEVDEKEEAEKEDSEKRDAEKEDVEEVAAPEDIPLPETPTRRLDNR